MKRLLTTFGAALALLIPAGSAVHADGQNILEFGTMTPVTGPYVGTTIIRNVHGGGIPWLITSGEGQLSSGGSLEVEVHGLVLATTHQNPIPSFQAVVSCQSIDRSTTPASANIVNVHTASFPASMTGNSEIQAHVNLPSPCIAPIVFVTSPAPPATADNPNPTGNWFAATGVSMPSSREDQ
jgi:hypothetical protein